MTAQTTELLINAGLFGLATSMVCLALALIGLCVWQVYKACFSPMAKRRQAFNKRMAVNRAHNRRMLGLSAR